MNIKHRIIFALCAATMCGMAWAVPAKPGVTRVKQSDGTTLLVHKIGDEHFHRTLTDDGLSVSRAADGNYYYRTASGLTKVMAHNAGERNAAELAFLQTEAANLSVSTQLKTSRRQAMRPRRVAPKRTQVPQTGTPRVPIILVSFADKDFHDADPMAKFTGEFNTNEYSALRYFTDQSHGAFTPQFDIYGPVQLGNYATYGRNDGYGDDIGVGKMVTEAIEAMGNGIDWSLYNNDNDTIADVAIILYAGMGEATCSDESTVWPCQWELSDAVLFGDGNGPIEHNGVTIDKFAVFNEMYGEDDYGDIVDQVAGIGTFCHEFSHCLGLPDFYDTNYGNHFGMGYWSLMDAGGYCGDGYRPCGYTAHERNFMGWLALDSPEENTLYTLDAMTTEQPHAIKVVNDKDPNEYYVLENRQNEGWDEYLYSHGLMVTHVTYNASAWDGNTVNNYNPQRMTIIPADGVLLMDSKYDFYSGGYYYEINIDNQKGDLYPYNGNNQLTDDSNPAAKVNTGNYMGKPITEITETDGKISFWFMQSPFEKVVPQFTDTTAIDTASMTLHWTPVDRALSYTLQLTEASYVEPESALLLSETFPTTKFDAEGSVDISSKLDDYMDNAGWTGEALFKDNGGIRMGKSQGKGSLTSPEITLTEGADKVTVKFTAKAYHNDTDVQMTVAYGDQSSTITVANDTPTDFVVVLNAENAKGKVKLATTANRKRSIITGIEIYSGDASQVQNAPMKRIEISGDQLKQVITGITDTCYTATDLLPYGLYDAKVRVTYDDNSQSAWSDPWSIQLHAPQQENPYKTGDVNGDGIVDVSDVNIVIDIILGKDSADNYDGRANLDDNSIVDIADVNLLIDIILGK